MKKILLSTLLLLGVHTFALEPTDGIKIDGKEYKNIDSIASTIDEKYKTYKQNDYKMVNDKIKKSNKIISNQLIAKQSEISNLINYSTTLSTLDDIEAIHSQIEQKKQAIEDAKKDRDEKLSALYLKAIYFVYISNASSKDSINKSKEYARNAITPKAIEKLNGTFIESLTTGNGSKFKEQITAKITGSMKIDGSDHNKFKRDEDNFFYIAKVSVSPLQGVKTSEKSQTQIENSNLHIQAIEDGTLSNENDLFDLEVQKEFQSYIDENYPSVVSDNERTLQTQQTILNDFARTLKNVGAEIKVFEEKIEDTNNELSNLYKKIGYTPTNPNIKDAKTFIANKIASLEKEKVAQKSDELFIAKSSQTAESDNPTKDIAQMASSLISQLITSHEKVDNFSSTTILQNGEIADQSKQHSKSSYRKIESFWVYPIPINNSFEVVVVAKFKINSTKALPKQICFNGNCAFENELGELAIGKKFGSAGDFDKNGLARVEINEKWGFINTKGEMVIPAKYEYVYSFTDNGLAAVQLNGKYGFINTKGEMVIPAKYENDFSAYSFADNGLAAVILNGKYGFINTKGEMVIPAKYDYVGDYVDGLAAVEINGKWGFINIKGEMVIPAKYSGSCGDYEYPSFADNGLAAIKLKDKCGYINKNGKVVIPFKYDDTLDFSENGLAAVEINGKWGYINTKGDMVISPKYTYASTFSTNGLAAVEINGKYGFINSSGTIVIPPKFNDWTQNFWWDNGLLGMGENDKYGAINSKGEWIIPPQYEKPFFFDWSIVNGLAEVTLNGKKMLIDEKGNEYNSPVYNALKNGTIDTLIANFKPQE